MGSPEWHAMCQLKWYTFHGVVGGWVISHVLGSIASRGLYAVGLRFFSLGFIKALDRSL